MVYDGFLMLFSLQGDGKLLLTVYIIPGCAKDAVIEIYCGVSSEDKLQL